MTSGSVFSAREATYTTREKLRRPRQIKVGISLRALPCTRPRINSDRKSGLASARNGFIASEMK